MPRDKGRSRRNFGSVSKGSRPDIRCDRRARVTAMDYGTLETLRRRHPAWRLLMADHAPLVVSFLHDTFIQPNVRTLSQPELAGRLEDYLYALRIDLGEQAFPRDAAYYLDH